MTENKWTELKGKYDTLLLAAEKALEFMERVEDLNWEDGGSETLKEVDEFRVALEALKE